MHRRVHCSSEPGGVRASGTRPHPRIAPAADQSAREREGGKAPRRGGAGEKGGDDSGGFPAPLPSSLPLSLSLPSTQDVEGGARAPPTAARSTPSTGGANLPLAETTFARDVDATTRREAPAVRERHDAAAGLASR